MKYDTNVEIMKAITRGDYGDPFSVLGMHDSGGGLVVRVFFPDALEVDVVDRHSHKHIASLERLLPEGFFAGQMGRRKKRFGYKLRVVLENDELYMEDPYSFGEVWTKKDSQHFAEGANYRLYDRMGAHCCKLGGIPGVLFAVWAPNASRVSVVGDFNNWDGRRHVMRLRHKASVWEIFIPDLVEGDHYMYEIKDRKGNLMALKSDPMGFAHECPPRTVSEVADIDSFKWADKNWMKSRAAKNALDAPISVYEVHLGSWRRVPEEGNRFLTYRELAEQLVPYLQDMGFTHLQVMPVHEHPYYGSWGYQPLGLFAPTRRYGTPADFKYLVEQCHKNGIGIFMDWVPGHFPTDDHGLSNFDGTSLYEHADPRQGFHPDWTTYIYNFGRTEVSNFLINNALFWLDRYHIDGLRVDAVASMLYLDYSRQDGEWVPNQHGGNTNLEAIDLLRRLNELVGDFDGAITIAEESTAWPGVSRPTSKGGLGFNFKWNMGWMHDTLEYMKLDPIYRRHHHHKMTFGMVYAFNENFMLPLSHDEVVHMKGSLLTRMPGDSWRRFANLRAYYGFMWGHPGKKLLFMGGEFAQEREWNHEISLDWHLTQNRFHHGVQTLVRDLNFFYRETPALHQLDCEPEGFQWIKVNEEEESYYAWLRFARNGRKPVLCVTNLTPVIRENHRLGVPNAGFWAERINTDLEVYGGSNVHNGEGVRTEDVPADEYAQSLVLTLPPLATLFLEYTG
ncbi:MAG: 1,4-alpha-glucan branching protein GlgB [Acidobacteriota bacterium]|nr:1,4-alpha-glucan branching protein GlgB [Acidobacteriota bacterium]